MPCHRHSSFCSHPLSAPQAGGSLVPPGGIAEPQQAAGSHSSPEQHRAQLPQLPCAIPTVRDPRQAGAWLPEGSTQQPLPNCQSGWEETAPAGNMRVLLGAASTLMERQGSGGTSHSTASTPLRGNVERPALLPHVAAVYNSSAALIIISPLLHSTWGAAQSKGSGMLHQSLQLCLCSVLLQLSCSHLLLLHLLSPPPPTHPTPHVASLIATISISFPQFCT